MHLASRTGSLIGALILPSAAGDAQVDGFIGDVPVSALGVYNGNVYETLRERVKDEPLNQTEVVPGYEVRLASYIYGSELLRANATLKQYIKPMLKRGQKLAEGKIAKL